MKTDGRRRAKSGRRRVAEKPIIFQKSQYEKAMEEIRARKKRGDVPGVLAIRGADLIVLDQDIKKLSWVDL